MIFPYTLLVIFLVIKLNYGRNYLDEEHDALKEIFKDYDWRIRPPGNESNGSGPVIVTANFYIRSISNVDEANMAYDMQITFREEWFDKRLSYENFNSSLPDFLVLPIKERIWMPDTFFQNEKNSHLHYIDQPNVLIRIYRSGQILYSVRISLTLSCPMNFKFYPMDVQYCRLDFASYAYTAANIEYRWKENYPIQVKPGLVDSLPQFTLGKFETSVCTSITNTGTYSCLRTAFKLNRQFGYYLFHLYLPGIMLVIVSWLSFWLDPNAVPGRVTLGVTTLLTMATMSSSINNHLPPVSYIKAIDVWIGMCTCYLFGSLIEFALCCFLYNMQLEKNKQIFEDEDNHQLLLEEGFTHLNRENRKNWRFQTLGLSMLMAKIQRDAKNIDAFSRYAFPITFFLCNITYWWTYTRERFQ